MTVPFLLILNMQIILCFTIFYLFLAIFANWVRHTSISSKLKRCKAIIFRYTAHNIIIYLCMYMYVRGGTTLF